MSTPCAADVSDAKATRNYVDRTVAKFGKIDVLFSNAGNQGPVAPITEYPEDVFDAVIAVHVRGAFLACKYAIPQMNDGGSIVITSSVVGVMGAPGSVAYVAAKHAHGRHHAQRLQGSRAAQHPRATRCTPARSTTSSRPSIDAGIGKLAGGVDGRQLLDSNIPLGRHARPDEIARSALYLASDMSGYVTGATLVADGGLRG